MKKLWMLPSIALMCCCSALGDDWIKVSDTGGQQTFVQKSNLAGNYVSALMTTANPGEIGLGTFDAGKDKDGTWRVGCESYLYKGMLSGSYVFDIEKFAVHIQDDNADATFGDITLLNSFKPGSDSWIFSVSIICNHLEPEKYDGTRTTVYIPMSKYLRTEGPFSITVKITQDSGVGIKFTKY